MHDNDEEPVFFEAFHFISVKVQLSLTLSQCGRIPSPAKTHRQRILVILVRPAWRKSSLLTSIFVRKRYKSLELKTAVIRTSYIRIAFLLCRSALNWSFSFLLGTSQHRMRCRKNWNRLVGYWSVHGALNVRNSISWLPMLLSMTKLEVFCWSACFICILIRLDCAFRIL